VKKFKFGRRIVAGMTHEDIKKVLSLDYPKLELQDGPWSGQTGYIGFKYRAPVAYPLEEISGWISDWEVHKTGSSVMRQFAVIGLGCNPRVPWGGLLSLSD